MIDHKQGYINEQRKRTTKEDMITVNVNRYYTDMNGTILDKTTVPDNLKVKFPFYLFNAFDKQGAYKIGNTLLPPIPPTEYLYSFVAKRFFNYFDFNPLNDIRYKIKAGDIVHVYCDNQLTPSYLIWIVISSPFTSIASITENTLQILLEVFEILYTCDNVLNYNEALHLIEENEIGVYRDEQYLPLSFKGIDTVLQDFISIKLKIMMTRYIGIGTFIYFDTENMIFNFKIKI